MKINSIEIQMSTQTHETKLVYINLVNNSTLAKADSFQLEACYQSRLSGRYSSMVEIIGTLAECLAKRAELEAQYWEVVA